MPTDHGWPDYDDPVAAAEARFERAYRAWCESKAFTEETLKEYHAAFTAVIRAKLPRVPVIDGSPHDD